MNSNNTGRKSSFYDSNTHGTSIMKRRNEFILVAILAVLIITAFIFMRIQQTKDAFTVEVSIDGKETATYQLNEKIDTWIDGYQGGKNHLIINDSTVKIEEADCPDKLCVKQGVISKSGETVVCLPHRVVVTIK